MAISIVVRIFIVVSIRRTLLLLVALVAFSELLSQKLFAADWQQPTKEELSMTSILEVPGANAVYLYRDETSDDRGSASLGLDGESNQDSSYTLYVRMKILTEAGKKYADVPIEYPGRYFSVAGVEGRTIHSDGTIIPFTGKPFQKEVYKTNKFSEKETFFTMPDVQVGSILEYRFVLRYDARMLIAPEWRVQSDLFIRNARYYFRAYNGENAITVQNGYMVHLGDVAYTSVLPKAAAVKMSQVQKTFELLVHDVPPLPTEDYMLPVHSMGYRVLFYYTDKHSPEQFWSDEGSAWSKDVNHFASSSKVKDAVAQIVSSRDSDQQKLIKIYDAVMKLENTSFTREVTQQENKQAGLKTKTADDIWEQKRGNEREITLLFIAMARAAGMKGYAVRVASRDETLFDKNYLNIEQLNDYVAIVEVNGKEQFFDPGERYCEFGKLHWKHTSTDALRQTYESTVLIKTPDAAYKEAQTVRSAQLQLGPDGSLHGTITIKMSGVPALEWRQKALQSDEDETKKAFEKEFRATLPLGVEANFNRFVGLEDWKSVLTVQLDVSGSLGMAAGKRVILPSSFFQANSRPLLVGDKRETMIYLKYASAEQDSVTIALPKNFEVESLPQDFQVTTEGVYTTKYAVKDNTYTFVRLLVTPNFLYPMSDFSLLRDFYQKISTQDQQQAILKIGATIAQQ
ncbi:MAG TPA: DUF3857 domain-containing protein [Terriglobales bacterium]